MTYRTIARRLAGLSAAISFALAADAFAAGPGNFGTGAGGAPRGGALGDRGLTSGTSGEASGLGIFSRFPFRVTLALQEGYDDNVSTRSFVQQGSAFTNASIGLDYSFGSERTQINARLGGGLVYYYDRPQQSGPDYNAFFELGLTHKFTARLSLEISAYTTYQTEPDFSLDISINRRSGSYIYSSDRFRLNYQFTPRFSTVTSYTFSALNYNTQSAGQSQNRIENTIGNEFRYLLLPTITAIGEYRFSFTDYMGSDSEAITHSFLAGFDYTFSPRFNVTFRSGVQLRKFESSATSSKNSDRISPDFESNMTYQLSERSAISWTNRYGIQESEGSANDTSRSSYRTGLNISYGLTSRISSRLAFFYNHNSFDSNGLNTGNARDNIDIALTLRYALTRYLGITAGYNRTDVFGSDSSGNDYSRNRFYGGIDFVF